MWPKSTIIKILLTQDQEEQKFIPGDFVKVEDKFIAATEAVVVGSYFDQFGPGKSIAESSRRKKRYTLEFESGLRVSWYDEDKLTLIVRA